MNIETIRDYVLGKPWVTEGMPFGETVIVYKVKEKVFLLISLDTDLLQFNVKCDPDRAVELREEYPGSIIPGYHMNKKHWNTVIIDGRVPARLILEMIDDSYKLAGKIR